MLEEKITEVLDKLVELREKLGTPAFDAVVRGVQLDVMISLIGGGLAFVLALVCVGVFATAMSIASGADGDSIKENVAMGIVIVSGALGVASIVSTPITLLQTSHWIAAFDPVAEIARRLVGG